MKYFLLIIISVITFIFSSCKEDNPVPPGNQPQVSLTLEDASCTEAWIKLSTADLALPADVDLYTDSSLTETISLSSTDTLLYVDSLLPNQTYNFHTVISSRAGFRPAGSGTQHSYNHTITSDPLTVTTMDTTSHNFTFETFTFGGTSGTSTLYDVAIINENDIWAVGEIYLLDTTGVPDPNAYNAVHWDGNQWELKRIRTNACGGVVYPPIQAIFSFSADDMLFAHIDGSITHYNGIEFTNNCSLITQLNGSAKKIWGKASNDFYVVSGNGFIAYNQNSQWSRIESGTDLNIGDIWGIQDDNGGYNKYLAADNSILIINTENDLQSINTESGHSLSSIWGKTVRLIYTAGGNGLSLYKNYKWEKTNQADVNTIYCIRGSDFNNVFGLSSTYSILHFNGYTWQYILPAENNIYYRLDVKSNVTAAVGWQGNKAVVTLIKRNN